jgi:hypothetical protein
MANQPKTPHRTIRVAPDLWGQAQVRARENGETVSDVIRRALESYVAEPLDKVYVHPS